jgi:hypothetical protein
MLIVFNATFNKISAISFLLCTPIVTQEEENESNHATLDVGVKTLMSGRIFFYNITFIVNISLFIILNFSYIVAVSFIGGGSQSTRRKLPIHRTFDKYAYETVA